MLTHPCYPSHLCTIQGPAHVTLHTLQSPAHVALHVCAPFRAPPMLPCPPYRALPMLLFTTVYPKEPCPCYPSELCTLKSLTNVILHTCAPYRALPMLPFRAVHPKEPCPCYPSHLCTIQSPTGPCYPSHLCTLQRPAHVTLHISAPYRALPMLPFMSVHPSEPHPCYPAHPTEPCPCYPSHLCTLQCPTLVTLPLPELSIGWSPPNPVQDLTVPPLSEDATALWNKSPFLQ